MCGRGPQVGVGKKFEGKKKKNSRPENGGGRQAGQEVSLHEWRGDVNGNEKHKGAGREEGKGKI